MVVHATRKDRGVAAVADAVGYRGRKLQVVPAESVDVTQDAYWSGGTKSTYTWVRTSDLATLRTPSQHPAFDAPVKNGQAMPIRPGLVCVEHVIFCGKDLGLRIYAHPDEVAKMLPTPAELPEDEVTVLKFTSGLKNSYGGKTNIRLRRAREVTGITADRWNAASEALKGRGLLTKAGAITPAGRNALAATGCRPGQGL